MTPPAPPRPARKAAAPFAVAAAAYVLGVAVLVAWLYALDRSAVLLLLALTVPLFVLSYRMQHRSARELARLNERLRQDVEHRKTRESELKDAIRDLERFNAVAVGREARIIELKAEVNELLMESGRRKRYNIEQID